VTPHHEREGTKIGLDIQSYGGQIVEDVGSGIAPALGQWNHVVITYDKGGAGPLYLRCLRGGWYSFEGSTGVKSVVRASDPPPNGPAERGAVLFSVLANFP
jgi:hypothetical protein